MQLHIFEPLLFLPAMAGDPESGETKPAVSFEAPTGSEVILLVEDEDAVRRLARRVLERGGYTVIEARDGREGLDLCGEHPGPIDALVTDIVMPNMGGQELVTRALRLRPTMKVVFISGHAPNPILTEGAEKGMAFLRKPFSPGALMKKVRDVLDSGPNSVT